MDYKWRSKSHEAILAHFHWMRLLPSHPPHGTAGPNKGGNGRQIDVRLKTRLLFPETNNQAAWRALAKWLKHSSKHSNEMVDKERLPWHAFGNHRIVTLNIKPPGDAQNVTYVRIGQMNNFLGVGTACKFDA